MTKIHAGFWLRVAAVLIDLVLLLIVIVPILTMIYGSYYWESETIILGFWYVVINYFFPAVVVILFWRYQSATPGKRLLKLKIIDAKTGEKPSTARFIGRYFAYFVSAIPLLLGLIWVGVDKNKQAWHDKLAGTYVIRK